MRKRQQIRNIEKCKIVEFDTEETFKCGCTDLVKLVLNASVNLENGDVKEKAFNSCTGITEVKVGDKVIIDKNNPMIKDGSLAKIFSGLSDKLYKDAETEDPELPVEPAE